MNKLYSTLAVLVLAFFLVSSSWAQCPEITCPTNINTTVDPGECGAVVTFTAPQGIDPCASGSETFNYTGSVQSFTAPTTGVYTLEAWGAQGGNDPQSPGTIFGGRGGYASGEVYLNGEIETRNKKKLFEGDVVKYKDKEYKVTKDVCLKELLV